MFTDLLVLIKSYYLSQFTCYNVYKSTRFKTFKFISQQPTKYSPDHTNMQLYIPTRKHGILLFNKGYHFLFRMFVINVKTCKTCYSGVYFMLNFVGSIYSQNNNNFFYVYGCVV